MLGLHGSSRMHVTLAFLHHSHKNNTSLYLLTWLIYAQQNFNLGRHCLSPPSATTSPQIDPSRARYCHVINIEQHLTRLVEVRLPGLVLVSLQAVGRALAHLKPRFVRRREPGSVVG